jgi:hypothetical protein
MDMGEILSKKILIRLSDSGDGFVSTIRYGPLFRRSKTWSMASQEEAVSGARLDDSSGPEDSSGG